jgi:hypothetical protein
MANKTTANLVKAQAKLIGAFQSSELRFTYPATYLALKAMSPIMFPNYDTLRTREDRVVETNYIARASRSAASGARTHNHTGVKQDSATLTPSWAIFADKFNISLKQADISVYSADEQLFNEISNAVSNMMESYETAAVDYLVAQRNATATGLVSTGDAVFTTATGKNAFEIAAANITRGMQITKVAMMANKYPAGYTVFCDSTSYATFEYQAAQGVTNATNLSFQFNGVTFVHSVGLGAKAAVINASYTKGFWIVVPNGTVATLPWIPVQNRNGVETPVGNYSNIINPIDGESYAVHTYLTAADDSANNGYTQDVVTQYELSQDLAFVKAPLSTANASTILAFAQL